MSVKGLDKSSKSFLSQIISDYNETFQTNFSINNLDEYYKNVSDRLKPKKTKNLDGENKNTNGWEIDILIVVNMFLTGFDAPTLNTLWVDKNLSEHTLIQAFSRTNRCFGETKKFGNIFSFRDIRENFDQALKMYADKRGLKDIKSNMVMREFEE
ncbi:type I restriction enzyme subunit R domain-containing protein, partial [Mycoplasmoides pneumoniae]|uniref:type I restriction enzyme subunit R domain-containing protein n=2 Tax=Mycoplasmoides pneumoniae TaxID=2104 RepID=UPI003A884E50